MSLQCAISGEPLTAENTDEIVVTPSGHLCLKRLLLTKLSENGGVDPFSDSGRPLSEDDLVPLQSSKNRPNMPPPPSSVSSFSGTLQQLTKEYDSVLLELFDTRKALQETRRELSQALYQNDAAIRVVSRLSMERDAARQDAQRFQAMAEAGEGLKPSNGSSQGDNTLPPTKKKPRLDNEKYDFPLTNDLPTSDLDTMLGSWEKLHQARKSKPKTTYTLPTAWKVAKTGSWHKSTCRGLTAIAQYQKFIATAGKDKQIIVYDCTAQQVAATLSTKALVQANALDLMPSDDGSLRVVAGCSMELRVYDSTTQNVVGSINLGDTIVGASGHPTGQHCCAATKNGKLSIVRVGASEAQHITMFEPDKETVYSCGVLHPDGLIYVAGTAQGELMIWDLKSKTLAGTVANKTGPEESVTTIAFSSNGYHVASAHASGAVRVWDIRKNKMMVELNVSGEEGALTDVSAVAFHPDGKYLAYGGNGGVHITMVKEWKVSVVLPDVKDASSLVWDSQFIASISDKARLATFHEAVE